MTGFGIFGRNCERAREWSSLRLDGELSELERALLDAHVGSCPPCAAFERDVTAATGMLRTAALVQPTARLELPSRRRSVLRPGSALAAAAVVATALGVTSLLGDFASHGPAVGHATNARRAPAGPASVEQGLLQEPRLLMRPGIKRGIGISI